MKILAFDTSNQTLTVALVEGEELVADFTLTIKKNHSITLMPAIDFVMKQADWQPSDLDRIVVAKGPGSYTGIRMAVATAKTLAYSLGCELVGVSSLRALVPKGLDGLVIPLINARRNAVYTGIYEDGQAVLPDAYMPLEDLFDRLDPEDHLYFVGEVEAFEEQIEERFSHAHCLPNLPSAADIAFLGKEMEPVEVHSFEPAYLKRVEAEENWLKDHEEGKEPYIQRL